MQGFRDNQARVQFESELISKGYTPKKAADEWFKNIHNNLIIHV